MVKGRLLRRMLLSSADAGSPKAERASASPMMVTGTPGMRSSSARKDRPARSGTPRTSKKLAVTTPTGARRGTPPGNERLAALSCTPATPAAIVARAGTAENSSGVRNAVRIDPSASLKMPNHTMASRLASVTPGSGRQSSQLPMLTIAVNGPIDSARATSTVNVNPRDLRSVLSA
jgi:hypothetical protein